MPKRSDNTSLRRLAMAGSMVTSFSASHRFTVVPAEVQDLATCLDGAYQARRLNDLYALNFTLPDSFTACSIESTLLWLNMDRAPDESGVEFTRRLIEHIETLGFRPATIWELLSFGIAFPGEWKGRQIVALGGAKRIDYESCSAPLVAYLDSAHCVDMVDIEEESDLNDVYLVVCVGQVAALDEEWLRVKKDAFLL